LFDRARLAGKFRKAQHARLLDASCAHHENGHGVFFSRPLENDGVEVFETPREIGQSAQRFGSFFDPAMDCRGSLEIERFARRLAFAFEFRRQRGAAGREKRDDAAHFRVVVLLRATREARGEAHLHFGINAAGKTRIAANLDLATPNFKQV
jgi:hypothetical protein